MKGFHASLLAFWILVFLGCSVQLNDAFTISSVPSCIRPFDTATAPSSLSHSRSFTHLHAGGFEWNDPTEAFEQGVDNPYKNTALMKGEEGIKIDPARLLAPRLGGVNLYLVGMMGSGKSRIGNLLARSKLCVSLQDEIHHVNLLKLHTI
jgi:hypothetical protein